MDGLISLLAVFAAMVNGVAAMTTTTGSTASAAAAKAKAAGSGGGDGETAEGLVRLEEKMRGFEAVTFGMKLARMDYAMEQISRRVENIETVINRFEVKWDMRMDKIEEETTRSKRKEEFTADHLTRQIDAIGDKVLHKIAFVEAKLLMNIDNLSSKFERTERQLQNSMDEVLERFAKGLESPCEDCRPRKDDSETTAVVKDLQAYVKEEFTGYVSQRMTEIGSKIDNGLQKMNGHVEKTQNAVADLKSTATDSNAKINRVLNHLESRGINKSHHDQRGREGFRSTEADLVQLNNLTNVMAEAMHMGERRFRELDNDMEVYTKKVLNTYQELLKSSRHTEEQLGEVIHQTNQTRTVVKDGFRKLYQQIRPFAALETKVEEQLDGVHHKISELGVAVDSSFASLLIAQNAFIASCHRIQQQEPQMEHKIYNLLQQIINQMPNNTTLSNTTNSLWDNSLVMSMVTNHNIQVGKALNDLVWTMLTIGNQSKDDFRRVLNQLDSMKHDHGRRTCMIRNGEWDSLIKACDSFSTNRKGKNNKVKAKSSDTPVHRRHQQQWQQQQQQSDSAFFDNPRAGDDGFSTTTSNPSPLRNLAATKRISVLPEVQIPRSFDDRTKMSFNGGNEDDEDSDEDEEFHRGKSHKEFSVDGDGSGRLEPKKEINNSEEDYDDDYTEDYSDK